MSKKIMKNIIPIKYGGFLDNVFIHRPRSRPTVTNTNYSQKFNLTFKNKSKILNHKFNNNNIINKRINFKNNNNIAKSLGFKDTLDLDNFIKNVNPYNLKSSEVKKISKLYSYFSKIAKKRPTNRLVKLAIAGGTITTMIIFLQNYQKTYTGCFRYDKYKGKEQQEIKYKFDGVSWCNNIGNNNNNNKDVKLIPETQHPLYNKKKWDCNYDKFPIGNNQVDRILNLGCNGLCNWKNFNILAKTTKGEYEPIIYDDDDKYVYKCETINMLQALTISTGDAFSDLFDWNLDNHFINTVLRIIFIVILIYIIIKFYSYVKK